MAKKSAVNKISLKLALRNIMIKPYRAVMTVLGVMGCVALLVCAFGINDTVNNSLQTEFGGQFHYDIQSTCAEENAQQLNDYLDEIGADYETYRLFYMSAAVKNSKDVKVFCIRENSEFCSINTNGEKVYISASTAKQLGATVGDVVKLTIGNSIYEVTVTDICDTAVSQGLFLTTDRFDEEYHILNYWINVDENKAEYLDRINHLNGTSSAIYIDEYLDKVENVVSSIDTMSTTLMIFAILLSVVVLFNLALLNVKERERDIATLKVLGFNDIQISKSLLYETMILVIVATAFGLLLGFPVLYLVMANNSIEAMAFLYYIQPLSYVLSACISIVTALVINLAFGYHIKKISMLNSLKSVE